MTEHTERTEELMEGPYAEEIAKLVLAWEDRGVTALEAAMILAGSSHAMMCSGGIPLTLVIDMVTKMWLRRGGRM